jgi:O-antigen/teichoic acid export membrane protein
MSTTKEMVRGFSWNTVTVVLQVVIQLVYTAIMARWIAPEDFAMMGVVLSMMGFAEIFSQVGIGPAIIQRKNTEQRHVNGAFWTALALGLFFTLGFVLCAPWLAKVYAMPRLELITQVVSTSFVISALGVVPRSFLMKKLAFKSFFFASMVSIVGGNLIIGLTLAYAGYGVWAYVWALFAQNALMTIAMWFAHPISIGWNETKKGIKDLLHYGAGSTLFNALNYAATKVDVTLVPLGLPAQQWTYAGWYERSAYVVSLPITIMAKLSDNVLFSGMSKMQDDWERLRRMVIIMTNALSIAIIPTSIWVIFNASFVMELYLGEQYSGAGIILQYLFVGVIFRTLNRVSDALLRAKDATFRASWIKGIYVSLMVLGTWFAIPFGVDKVGLIIAFTTMIHYLMGAWLGQKVIQGNFFEVLWVSRYGIMLGIVVAMGCFILQLTFGHGWMSACVGLGWMTVIYLLAIFRYRNWLGPAEINPLQILKK